MVSSITIFSSCNKDDDDEGSTAVELLSFGPSPALRGGELKIIGRNLDRVTAVVLPEDITVDNFDSQTSTLITLTIPEATVEGRIVLKTLDGDIESLSMLTISEPIVLASFSPATVRPGDVLTIQGDYLNLIAAVIFTDDQVVEAADFISQSKEQLEVTVPEAAQTGPVTLSNGEEMPILVASEEDLAVKLPQVTSLSPNPVKAGTTLTITGTDLDLARQVIFADASPVTTFSSQSATTIELEVPDNAHDGAIKLQAASLLQTSSEEDLVMVVPTISGMGPLPVKNGTELTISGTDLDLTTSVSFGGGASGTILSIGENELTVTVPMDATEGPVTVFTAADKSVSSADPVTLVMPTLTAITPTEAQFGDEITLQGTDLDLVTHVVFTGDVQADVNMATADMATVTVPVAAQTGPFTLFTTNGTGIVSSFDLTILVSTNAVITSIPGMAAPGDMISIVGENLDEINEVIFPDEVPATMFGTKTATLIEVFVPMATAIGPGNIKFVTFTGEEFFSPEINFQGVEPVADPGLVFFNFDDLGSWWGDTGGVENDPSLSLDGSNYFRVNASLSGWAGFFWRNGGNGFPGAAIGTDVANYVLKFDINVLEPLTGGVIHWRLKGSEGDFWYRWLPWEATGSYSTNGWVTVTIPLTSFTDNYGWGSLTISDLNSITEDFGVAFNEGNSMVNLCIDNVRFEHQ
jgi:hypothetical protein